MLPENPAILLSFTNTQLRNHYKSLADFCKALDVNEQELIRSLEQIDYHYCAEENQFK